MSDSTKSVIFAFVIELERHIEILLLSNDCVIVPDFGGFMAHHVDACYDKEEDIFFPPQRTLGFNPQLTLNDSLLVQSYIEAYDISYPEALRRIEDEVRELKQHLEHKAEYEFNGLGIIRMNDEGKYEFTPCEAGILTPDLYGLNSFEMERLQLTSLVSTINIETKPITNAKEEAEESIEAEVHKKFSSNIFLDDEDEEPYTIHPGIVRNLLAACVAALAFLLFPANIGNGDSHSMLISKIDTGMLTRIISSEVTPKPVVIRKIAIIAKSHASTSKDSIELPQAPFYTIVLCSRVSLKNATNYKNTLHNTGYTKAEVLQKGKSVKVIYGKYPTENQAYNILNKLNNRSEFKDCWVMKVKAI
ncbi:Sporulation related domain-containing protein [Prevotella sp. KH2C16]|nr:Sporulation related domain-containing protein [Prevotella sp. KH2C16]